MNVTGHAIRTSSAARLIDEDDLVIADAAKPVALAGVIGGQPCSVHDSTTSVFLECAYFL